MRTSRGTSSTPRRSLRRPTRKYHRQGAPAPYAHVQALFQQLGWDAWFKDAVAKLEDAARWGGTSGPSMAGVQSEAAHLRDGLLDLAARAAASEGSTLSARDFLNRSAQSPAEFYLAGAIDTLDHLAKLQLSVHVSPFTP